MSAFEKYSDCTVYFNKFNKEEDLNKCLLSTAKRGEIEKILSSNTNIDTVYYITKTIYDDNTSGTCEYGIREFINAHKDEKCIILSSAPGYINTVFGGSFATIEEAKKARLDEQKILKDLGFCQIYYNAKVLAYRGNTGYIYAGNNSAKKLIYDEWLKEDGFIKDIKNLNLNQYLINDEEKESN